MGVFEQTVSTFLSSLKKYLEDESVTEVLVNGPDEVFIERAGLLEKTDANSDDEQALQAAVRNIAQFVGRRVDDENPVSTLDFPMEAGLLQ